VIFQKLQIICNFCKITFFKKTFVKSRLVTVFLVKTLVYFWCHAHRWIYHNHYCSFEHTHTSLSLSLSLSVSTLNNWVSIFVHTIIISVTIITDREISLSLYISLTFFFKFFLIFVLYAWNNDFKDYFHELCFNFSTLICSVHSLY
jgi:hypothetical protein